MDDRTYDPNSQKLEDTKSGYISGDRDGYFKVAVDLRATQPDRNGCQLLKFGSYRNVGQQHDRTYDRNSQKLEDTKSGYISGDRDGNLKWPSISERRSPAETIANC